MKNNVDFKFQVFYLPYLVIHAKTLTHKRSGNAFVGVMIDGIIWIACFKARKMIIRDIVPGVSTSDQMLVRDPLLGPREEIPFFEVICQSMKDDRFLADNLVSLICTDSLQVHPGSSKILEKIQVLCN